MIDRSKLTPKYWRALREEEYRKEENAMIVIAVILMALALSAEPLMNLIKAAL